MEFASDSGAVTAIRTAAAPEMNWVGFRGPWGVPRAKGHPLKPGQVKVEPESSRAVWSDGILAIDVLRSRSGDSTHWRETYRFRNLSDRPLSFSPTDLGIGLPFADDYKSGARVCLTARCHTHLWAEGSSAWVCALAMNSRPPHLGVVLTRGGLDGYSITDREWDSNDRGVFLVHPVITEIPANSFTEISWVIFCHEGWDDFFAKASALNPTFIRMSAERYAVPVGETIRIFAESATALQGATLTRNGQSIEPRISGGRLSGTFTAAAPGEQVVELKFNERYEKLVVMVTPQPEDLLRARAEFLLTKKQLLDPQSPQDGSFPVLDLETGKFVFDGNPDHNTSRERMGSGAFIGLLWQRTPATEFRDRLQASFLRYYAFINREIQNPDGVVANDVQDFAHIRLYNYPWVVVSHLCAWRMTQDQACLQRLMAVLRDFYNQRNGAHFYVICQPISATLTALKEAGLEADYQEARTLFKAHAAAIRATGINIPRHEVAYEQSIMGPAMQITAETALATGDADCLAAAEIFRPMLEAFGGQQPHYRLHDIGIRHWDGYWFGKPRDGGRLYGDTMPHYWSTITAEAFRYYATVANRPEYFDRVRQILLANFSQFDANGAGHCAYLYPRSVNGIPAQYQDPYDNDQDWTLVHYLLFEAQLKSH